MAAAPRYKVYTPEGEYIAATKYADEAAIIVGFRGEGFEVRVGHAKRDVVYVEGRDGDAGDSVDEAAEVILSNDTGR